MTTHRPLLALAFSAVLAASAHASGHHANSGSAAVAAPAPARGTAPALGSAPQGFRYSGGPALSRSQHFSAYRGAVSGQRRFAPGAVMGTYNPARFANARSRNLPTARTRSSISNANATRSLASTTNNHIFARRSANWQSHWDRHRDHWWHGHRCRFVNGSWFIFDLGFYPWYGYPYDYFAYNGYYPDSYGYDYGDGYDAGAYEGGAPYYDNQDVEQSSDNPSTNAVVSAVQERLARQGYYRGEIDGLFGPATRRALVSYQRRNGLPATGSLTGETLQSLNLQTAPRY